MNKRFTWPVTPVAAKENIVIFGTLRFTVLTEQLIRIEQDPQGIFEDRASQSVFHRDFVPVQFSVVREPELVLETAKLRLTCGGTLESLCITLKCVPGTSWHYGDPFETLGGTVSTLDTVDGEIPVEPGVCSRQGFAVLDDSQCMILNDGWVDVRSENTKDLYFFGYGYEYKKAVADLYRLTGRAPLLPDYALGNWWSRYHAYTQEEYLALMDKFRREDIPFSVGVVDMDWHITELPDGESGWTGYTWNEELFPDYRQFLKDLHGFGIKTALNLHPARGVRKHEAMYEDMCKALGKPADGTPCNLDILSPEYMEKYFDVIHHPYEEDGVDFWWMGWQQGKDYHWIHEPNRDGKLRDPREILDPLWQLNHLHILDIQRDGKRPMFFSRYSGPGSQRYPVGFSGDTVVTWESLDFQPKFTAMASNVGYSWWSHDIGGHYAGYRDDDLTARWVQLGVFSPINRLHSSCNPFINKEPWDYDAITEKVMRQSLKLRHQLFPYLYTMNYRTHTQLEPLVQPMYYSHPQRQEAYDVKNQFWFGDQMIVAPITSKRSAATGMGMVKAWIPEGIWTDFFTGTVYDGLQGRMLDLYRDAYSIPVLCKAGAIVPMRAHTPHDNRLCGAEALEILVFPGADNSFTLYEDAGDGNAYQQGAFVTTELSLRYSKTHAVFTVAPAAGDRTLIPENRSYEVKFRGFEKPARVSVNGEACSFTYDPETQTIIVRLEAATADGFRVELEGEALRGTNANWLDRAVELLKRSQIGMDAKERTYRYLQEKKYWNDPYFFVKECLHFARSWEEKDAARAVLELYLCEREYKRP